ncbi:MAG TPA: DUF4252 domain-containing protein [Candidatus Polarisedimenticolaceae bacterium]|nr:DUF4252 domain-containing protein [Candidatus Polarisedimenticolaceae bacterium]
MRTARFVLAAAVVLAALPAAAEGSAPSSPGYVDGSVFRSLIDEDQEVVEVNLEGPMLKAIANSKRNDEGQNCAKDLFANLTAVHAVIGSVKGPAEGALKLVQQTDQKLHASGWQRVTRIKDESSWVSLLTHVTADQIDGVVALIFDMEDKELVFANLAGSIDLDKLGDIGDCINVPGLEHVTPGAH